MKNRNLRFPVIFSNRERFSIFCHDLSMLAIHRMARSAKAVTGAAVTRESTAFAVSGAAAQPVLLRANKPAEERMARRRDRSLGARTVV
jgi:hypothetical protein